MGGEEKRTHSSTIIVAGLLAAAAIVWFVRQGPPPGATSRGAGGTSTPEPAPPAPTPPIAPTPSAGASAPTADLIRGAAADVILRDGKRDLAYLPREAPQLQVGTLPQLPTPGLVACNEHVEDGSAVGILLAGMDQAAVSHALLTGSPRYLFTKDPADALAGREANNEVLLQAAAEHPGRFSAFVSIDPLRPDAVEKLAAYSKRGARGLRLYAGRGDKAGDTPFHGQPLDAEPLRRLYDYCQSREIPIVMDVNLNKFAEELDRALTAFPNLRIMVTHWGIHKNTTRKLQGLSRLMRRHPNLYFGLSFGGTRWQVRSFRHLARWPKRYRRFLTEHADRFLFAGSAVVARDVARDYPLRLLRSYRQLLEMKAFRFYEDTRLPMRGLEVPPSVLRKIYWENPQRFLGRTLGPT